MSVTVDRVVTSGVFNLDGQDFDVDNNVWLVGDESEVVVVDAAHDAQAILDAVGDQRVVAIICTHAHNDHVNAVRAALSPQRARSSGCADDGMLWDVVNAGVPFEPLADGDEIRVARNRPAGAAHAGALARRRLPVRPGRHASCPATLCSTADPARQDGPSATSRRSSTRSASACCACLRTRAS
ncbi:MAG: MBL fold metallo-hydrolase [Candidatus Nanopelagicales bacterium]